MLLDTANTSVRGLYGEGDPMKKTAPKKMTLNRETIGTLNDKDMKAILGGATAPCETTSRVVCCN
jgi:natural product precursor